jgi:hypothetical protein
MLIHYMVAGYLSRLVWEFLWKLITISLRITRYKFHLDNGDVYIVDMMGSEHEALVSQLYYYFKTPNDGIEDDPPIDITLQSCKNSF